MAIIVDLGLTQLTISQVDLQSHPAGQGEGMTNATSINQHSEENSYTAYSRYNS